MVRRPTDYTAQMQATEERRRQQEERQREEAQRERELRDRQAKSYGEVVREIFPRGITIDALAGLLLDSRERLQSNAGLEAEWAARGTDYFRPANAKSKLPAEPERATGNGDAERSISEWTCRGWACRSRSPCPTVTRSGSGCARNSGSARWPCAGSARPKPAGGRRRP